jgi:hypothetical protein
VSWNRNYRLFPPLIRKMGISAWHRTFLWVVWFLLLVLLFTSCFYFLRNNTSLLSISIACDVLLHVIITQVRPMLWTGRHIENRKSQNGNVVLIESLIWCHYKKPGGNNKTHDLVFFVPHLFIFPSVSEHLQNNTSLIDRCEISWSTRPFVTPIHHDRLHYWLWGGNSNNL